MGVITFRAPPNIGCSLETCDIPRTPTATRTGLDEPQFCPHSFERRQREVEVVARGARRELTANPRMSLWNNRVAESRHEDALIEEQLAHADGFRGLAQDHWDDGSLALGFKPLSEIAGVLVEADR